MITLSTNITIATEKDIPALNMLVNNAYRGEGSKKGWTTEADLLDGTRTDETGLQELLKDPEAVILKYTVEEKLQACVYLKKKHTKLYLGMLTVSPELQAKGIGKQLLTAAENYAKQLGCGSITMTVISIRHELIAWYERHGYYPTGETEPFPVSARFSTPRLPLEFIVMEKELK
ncbi:MAG: GNAT family N-acetyltransferase [Bacteroidota bacterium]